MSEGYKPQPPPAKRGRKAPRHPLTTLSGVIGEIARVYRKYKAKRIDAETARTLTYILDKMRAGLEAQVLADLERKLDEAEAMAGSEPLGQTNGHAGYSRAVN